jgi:DNA-binding response OmpR family regulator
MQKILVVDDEELDLKFIKAMLNKLGYEDVEMSKGPHSVIYKMKKSPLSLILLDWHMPGVLGIDVLREIRHVQPKMPVLMVTGESRKERVVEAIRAGASDYLTKPFRESDLRQKVEGLIGQPEKN